MFGFSARIRRIDISADPFLKSDDGRRRNKHRPQLWGLSLGFNLNATVFVRRSYMRGNPYLDEDNSIPEFKAEFMNFSALSPPYATCS